MQMVFINPDIIATLQAIRVELHVRLVVAHIVPRAAGQPFQYWLRFEFGPSGSPHVHGHIWVHGSPQLEHVVADEHMKQKMCEAGHPHAEELRTWAEAEHEVASLDRH